jgi:magnesium chelatase subunit ChlD-like protein
VARKKSLSHPGHRLPIQAGGGRWRNPVAKLSAISLASLKRAKPTAPDDGPVIAWLRTLLAKGPAALRPQHLRYQPRSNAVPQLHCIVLDTSGSMRQGGRLALAKGFAARLIEEAARAGDHVALLSFGGRGVELLVSPGPARAAGAARVRQCGGGGGTPLAQALVVAQGLLARTSHATLWLLTDGRTLEQPAVPPAAAHTVIVDFDDPKRPLGRSAAWAARWGAEHRLAPVGTCIEDMAMHD